MLLYTRSIVSVTTLGHILEERGAVGVLILEATSDATVLARGLQSTSNDILPCGTDSSTERERERASRWWLMADMCAYLSDRQSIGSKVSHQGAHSL